MSALPIGSRLGPYEITAKLGEGGMGEVYRATDSRLKREVAIKVLPPAFTADAERLARFEREAQILAQLHHPNIASIFGLEESSSARALVMELVEGESLAERMARSRLEFGETLQIARQIAEALEAAHEKGIVHRDLKPQNVKLRPDGTVKVLDFGLAKALESAPGSGDPSRSPTLMNSPTLTSAGTQLGIILGTAAYMSPEQARGAAVDKRADIWAWGVLLHEMLTGKSLFAGDTVSDTLAGVLKNDIDLGELPAGTPAAIRRLLRRCLERNAKNRLHDIADARLVIDDVLAGKADDATGSAPPMAGFAGGRSRPLAAGLAVALLVGVAAAAWWTGRRSSGLSAAAPLRPAFRQLTKLPGGERHPSVSPDGESFVYVKADGDDLDLFVQRVDGSKSIPLTADCEQDDFDPAFSPDGRSIAFRSQCGGGGIFVMGATGESRRRVADFGFQPAWSPDGRELAVVTERLDAPTSRNSTSELWAVQVDSDARRKVTEHDAMGPTWSPDGRRIAFWGLRDRSFQRDLWTVLADGSNKTAESAVSLVDDPALDWAPVYSADGRWLYFVSTRGGTFNNWRLPVDAASGERRGEPEPITAPSSWTGPLSLAAGGHLVYEDFNMNTEILRAPLDLDRQELAAPPSTAFSGSFVLREQKLSPDGQWIVFTNEDLPQELHLVHPDGSGYRQLTEGDRNRQGDFSPDGAWIVFQTTRGKDSLAVIRPDGGGWQPLPVGPGRATPRWSPDGSTIAAYDNNKAGGVLVDLRGGMSAATQRDLPKVAPDVLFWPTAWSRDGKLLAGRATHQGQIQNIVVRDMAKGEYRELPRTEGALEDFNMTFVDGRRLVYTDNRSLWLRDVFAGESKKIYTPSGGHRISNVSATLDGRWLTWIERADESDIWLTTLEEAETRP